MVYISLDHLSAGQSTFDDEAHPTKLGTLDFNNKNPSGTPTVCSRSYDTGDAL